MITIFTDGSSRGNPGPGGWGAIIVNEQENTQKNGQKNISHNISQVIELGGREDMTTNNRMELAAAIGALHFVGRIAVTAMTEKITLNTDSSYVINGITKWVYGWKKKGWKTMDKKDVVNRDLWEELIRVSLDKSISWNYVGGHVGIAGNERCDEIATAFADATTPQLFSGSLADYPVTNILDISGGGLGSSSQKKTSSKSRSKAAAYSYVSLVNGVIATDATWKACEARVKGKPGSRYKKALNAAEEREIRSEFGGK
jgi:ribonuclease HI